MYVAVIVTHTPNTGGNTVQSAADGTTLRVNTTKADT